MRVTWSYREASKHPLADSRNRPAVPRLDDCAASRRLLLLSGSLSRPHPPPTHLQQKGQTRVCPACIMRPA